MWPRADEGEDLLGLGDRRHAAARRAARISATLLVSKRDRQRRQRSCAAAEVDPGPRHRFERSVVEEGNGRAHGEEVQHVGALVCVRGRDLAGFLDLLSQSGEAFRSIGAEAA